ncbi:aromatic amino acid ammonia-lyase [Odoribacter sp. OttesenSCG-928-L07]|nr:aromatic amino acid ammonia-lyase [Odoribacter sp. OttesenSCG-928-L07]MDL2238903.1 aromatic amino acid ammonia-lyase [Bacteroidales bacterium OttesenSCG-928-L14]MDL2240643.1 aromatic amino acid ammonia-lyase [Bacteroidales bacterium OttesenSCG-928-K22]
MNTINISNSININTFEDIILRNKKVCIEKNILDEVNNSYHFLESFSKDKLIYGINTGLGPMAQYRISDEKRIELQYNLIRSHAAGTGKHLRKDFVKAGMLCRLVNILQAKSGVHVECAELLRDFINNDIIPVIFEHGGVGASGDLVQLAHLALAMIGEGNVYYRDELMPAADAMKQCGLSPIKMRIREGLSLINGTSIMTGISIVNLLYAKKLFQLSVMASSMINEVVESYSDSFSKELNQTKLHKGQNVVAGIMREILKDSSLIKQRESTLYNQQVTENVIKEKVQEYYSIRCVPQILGPISDAIENAEILIINEANSVNDNPVVDKDSQNVYHGGNFHGDYVSFEMDKLKTAITKLTMINERQLNYLLNPNLNQKLPPFVNLGVKGLNLGLQAAQFTATSTTAECQTLSFPNYVHSIPNNNDNQDIVSMGTNSALITNKIIENAYEVLSIHYIALLQAIDFCKNQNKMSSSTKKTYEELREIIPVFHEDDAMYIKVNKMKDYLIDIKDKKQN